MTNKYIIGGGIAGLIFNFYNPEYKIISPELGGKIKSKAMQNIIYIHATAETKKLLEDLKISYTKKTNIIKYVKNNKVLNEIDSEDKITFIRKKIDDKKYEVKDINLSTNDYYISTFVCDYDILLNALIKRCDFIEDKVIRITDTEIITEKRNYEYDDLVSTIPANIFWKIYYKKNIIELNNKEITFVLSDKVPEYLEKENYDLCYFVDDKNKYTRISKKENNYLYEFTGNINKKDIKKYLPKDAKILEYFVEKNGLIITNKNNIPPLNIKFLGRFATHNHSDKMQDIIRESNWSYDLRHIFNRQKTFSSTRLDFNSFDNVDKKQEETKLLLLHLYNELAEVLDAINYKLHKKKKEINVDNVKEELMDSFKYLLNLFLIWGIDAKEFVELFNAKSKIVEERFAKEFKDEN